MLKLPWGRHILTTTRRSELRMTTGGQSVLGKAVAKKSKSADIEQQRKNAIEYQKKFLFGKRSTLLWVHFNICDYIILRVSYIYLRVATLPWSTLGKSSSTRQIAVTPNPLKNKRKDEDESTPNKKQKNGDSIGHQSRSQNVQEQRERALLWSSQQPPAAGKRINGKSKCHHLSHNFWFRFCLSLIFR